MAEEWDRWAKQELNALAAAYDKLATDPTEFSCRQRKLEGETTGTGVYEGKTLDRWQYEFACHNRRVASDLDLGRLRELVEMSP